MTISLEKGQKVDLTKGHPNLVKVVAGLGWDTNKYDGGFDFDLDAAAFLVGENGKVLNDGDFVFYNNLKHSSESVIHMGDNLTGEGDGDDEQVLVNLTKVPQNIKKISFTVTIFDAETRIQNFGQISNAYIRLCNEETGEELIRYDLAEDFSVENAIGSGFHGGLKSLCLNFGVNV